MKGIEYRALVHRLFRDNAEPQELIAKGLPTYARRRAISGAGAGRPEGRAGVDGGAREPRPHKTEEGVPYECGKDAAAGNWRT